MILRSKHKDLYEKINQLEGNTFSEKAWKFTHQDTNTNCYCGNKLKFLDFGRGYTTYCSVKCMSRDENTFQKRKNTVFLKYGVSHFSKTDEYKSKFKETCMSRYGVINPGQIDELKSVRARRKQLTFFNNVIEMSKDFSAPEFTFDDYTHLRDHNLPWRCMHCNAVFTSDLLDKLPKCPECYPRGNFGGQSSVEKSVLDCVREFYDGEIIENSREIIPPKEIDIYFPNEKFAIEINGIYWHNSLLLKDDYHRQKFLSCERQGIRLLMITDYEWQTKRELILKMIKHRLMIGSNKAHARKCVVRKESAKTVKEFFNQNHINGFCNATAHYSLVYNNEIVAALSCSLNRFSRIKTNLEIVRFAVGNFTIPGAFSKLLKQVKLDFSSLDIVSYADLRYGSGNVYLQSGFLQMPDTKPGYWYFVNNHLEHRLSWTKKKLVDLGYSNDRTEEDIMLNEIKALKIFDCGHRLYKWSSDV